jgi:hypothetical protein
MKKFKLDLEAIVLTLIILVLGSIVINSTRNALLEAKESNTKEKIYSLETAIKEEVTAKVDLMNYLEICIKGDYCKADQYFADNILLTKDKNRVPLIPYELKDSTGEFIKVKPTSESTYLIWGKSSKDENLCWIASSSAQESNLEKDQPSLCP